MNKYFLISIIFFTNSCIYTRSFKSERYFKVTQAYKQSWTAGIEKGGSGTDYSFELIINTNQNISFDSIWMNNKAFKLITTKRRKFISNEPITFSNGDTILLKCSESKNDNKDHLKTYPPVENDGAALIGYYLKNKRRYLVVKNIDTHSPLYYQ